jgi:hypothetical protein
MKINIKTATLISLLLGTLFYFLSNKKENKIIITETIQKATPILIDNKKPTELAAPKPLVVAPIQNGLHVSNNWKSK